MPDPTATRVPSSHPPDLVTYSEYEWSLSPPIAARCRPFFENESNSAPHRKCLGRTEIVFPVKASQIRTRGNLPWSPDAAKCPSTVMANAHISAKALFISPFSEMSKSGAPPLWWWKWKHCECVLASYTTPNPPQAYTIPPCELYAAHPLISSDLWPCAQSRVTVICGNAGFSSSRFEGGVNTDIQAAVLCVVSSWALGDLLLIVKWLTVALNARSMAVAMARPPSASIASS